MDEKKVVCKRLRGEFGIHGWALLIYYAIMNAMVMLIGVVDGVVFTLQMMARGMSESQTNALLNERIMSNGWGYLLATVLGAVLLYIWKKREFCTKTIWKTNKPMKVGSFFLILCVFISGQAFYQITAPLLDLLFGLMGFSLMDFMESAAVSTDTVSMFLYGCLAAPIFEEIIFRGLVLRSLEPYGKKFAILGSAFLFGIFHGNIVQSPYAFVVGLVLGYVTIEYSIGWAMVLHMINNLLLGDTLSRLTQMLPVWGQEIVFMVVIWGCTIAAIIGLIINREKVTSWFRQGKMHPWCVRSFFTSPGIIVLTVVLLLNIFLTLLLQ